MLTFKDLITECVKSERSYRKDKLPDDFIPEEFMGKKELEDPVFTIVIKGRKLRKKVKILTGINGAHLYGENLLYLPAEKGTLLLVRCYDVRDFLNQFGMTDVDIEKAYIEYINGADFPGSNEPIVK